MKVTNYSITFLDDIFYPPIKCRFPIMLKCYSVLSNFNGIWLCDFSKRNPISVFIFPENFYTRNFSCDHRSLTACRGLCKAVVTRNINIFVTYEVFSFFKMATFPYISIGHVVGKTLADYKHGRPLTVLPRSRSQLPRGLPLNGVPRGGVSSQW